MDSQKQTSSVLLASNVSKLLSIQNKIPFPMFSISFNYNNQLICDLYALHTTRH